MSLSKDDIERIEARVSNGSIGQFYGRPIYQARRAQADREAAAMSKEFWRAEVRELPKSEGVAR